ncbi:MAG: putative lipid II flippase FtsW [Bacillota bacterium]|nr:MAG: putative lipid II flippase FtsW [Bacillota bacterium]
MQAAIIERTRSVRRSGNWGIPVVAVLLAGFGVLMVYSASYYSAQQQTGDAFFYMKKQLAGLVLGGIAMAVMALFPYRKLKKLKWPALIISLVLLAAVFVPGLGVENYGATRWIGIGPITIQPSEISKYGFVLFASAYASEKPERMQRFVGMLPVLGAGGAVCVLIILEPNMSVTMCTGMIMLAMLFLSGVKMRHLLVILLPIAAAVPVLIIMEPYRLQRLYAFLDPWSSPQGEGYQLIQSLYALGNGGWFGTGLFRSVQKYRYLPFAESDFILSVIGEEFGFVGIVLLFCAFGLLIYFGIRTAAKSRDMFGFLMASGITAAIAVQTVINALVVSGSIPPTGLPLPLISAGNTSLVFTMAALGVLFNISKSEPLKTGS